MTTKVTLSSPPVQHQLLHDQPPVDGHEQQHDHHYGQTEETGYTSKRPPTPPKTRQQMASWKQHGVSSKHKDGYYADSPDRSQSNPTTPTTNNQKKTSKAYDYDQYMYHQQALKAENNKKGHVQQPPPSLKKHKDQLSELFMVQEQLDQASRERDQALEENSHLKYHLQVLQYRMQNVEYMWQSYNAAMWEKPHRQQQRQSYPYDPFGPPVDFISNRSLPERPLKSQPSDQRFRRHRSKSLPRKGSLPDNYPLPPSMMPPPMFTSMMAKLPMLPPPPQMFDKPPPFARMHNDPLVDMADDDDDDSGSDPLDDMDGIRRRHMYNDSGFIEPPPFPPLNTSFYPMYRHYYHQQQYPQNSSRPMPFGHQPPYYPGDDKEDKWDPRSIIPPPPPPLDRPPYDFGSRPTRLAMYPREEPINHQQYLQQPWMDPKLGPKQPTSYGDPLQQQQQAFYSPRHRRAHPA